MIIQDNGENTSKIVIRMQIYQFFYKIIISMQNTSLVKVLIVISNVIYSNFCQESFKFKIRDSKSHKSTLPSLTMQQ